MAYHKAGSFKRFRCYWYRDDSVPRVSKTGLIGCPNVRCGYAHPDDPEWPYAVSGKLLPLQALPDPPTSARVPPPPPSTSARPPSPRGPPPPPPPPVRERVASSSSASGQPPQIDRDRERDQDRDDDMARKKYGRGRSVSPAPSIESSVGSKPRHPYVASGARRREEEESRRKDERRRHEERRHDDRSRERGRRRDEDDYRRDRARGSRSPSRTRHGSSSNHHPRHPDSHDASTSMPPPPKKELSSEEIRKLWLERIRLLSEAVQVRGDHLRTKEDLQTYEKMAKSSLYETLPDDDKTALQNRISAASSRLQEKQRELNRIAGQLVPEDFWPQAQRIQQQQSNPEYQKMTAVLAALKEDVQQLYTSVGSIQALQQTATESTPTPTPAPQPEPGEITADSSSRPRPKKRRRLSVDGGVQISDIPSADFESMQERLVALDGRIAELRNDILQHENRIADEVEAHLDYRMSKLRLGVGGEADKPADPELQSKVEQVHKDFANVQARAAQAAEQLVALEAHSQSREERNAALQQQNDALRVQIEELEASQVKTSAMLEEQQKAIDALKAAVTTYISRPPDIPLQPGSLTADAIVEALRPRLLVASREDLLPILEDARLQIEKQLQDHTSQVNDELVSQMGPVVRSVEWISAWLERIRGSAGASNSTVTTTTSASASASTAASSASVDKGKGVAR
ncbi:hypothetical protein C8Q70DRAFT_938374 [Cubamyces menziesii]|nr:hypothetical protein C8Q70DRAFT_938374 [Cubamyces menziesii]